MYPKNIFDMIWASPPCTEYSRARAMAKRPRDLDGADRLVLQVLDIIGWFNPEFFSLERITQASTNHGRPTPSEESELLHVWLPLSEAHRNLDRL